MFRQCLLALGIASLFVSAPSPSFAFAQAARSASTKAVTTGIVNINTASATDLEGLPGIGAKTAARIVDYRQKNGPFKKVEVLMNISFEHKVTLITGAGSGIGLATAKTFAESAPRWFWPIGMRSRYVPLPMNLSHKARKRSPSPAMWRMTLRWRRW